MQSMAVLIPYRNRAAHLEAFLPAFQAFIGDSIPFNVYTIEQMNQEKFNRGKLLNIGFAETKDLHDWFVFHDVDMIPLEADYSYPTQPIHLATAAEQNNWTMPYPEYFGGVTLFNKQDFETINGYSNNYNGYGAEDDDLRFRCGANFLQVARRHGKFKCFEHERNFDGLDENRARFRALDNQVIKVDGLNSLVNNGFGFVKCQL